MPSRREVYAMEHTPSFGPPKLDESRFPKFRDGDVKIIITGARTYQLHKSILKNSSALFQQLLSDDNTTTLSKKAKKKGAVITNILRADIEAGEGGRPKVNLRAVKLNDEGAPVLPMPAPLDIENGLVPSPVYVAYDKVLGAFYHKPIDLADFGETTLNDIIANVVEILKAAEYLGCVGIVTQHFEATLLAMGQQVYRSIKADPAVWLDLAIRMQSKPLYREAIIHAIGQYNTSEMQDAFPLFDKLTRTLIKDKAQAIIKDVKKAEAFMLSYYPEALQRTPSTGLVDKEENSRSSYANDILHWMALTIFRHWLGDKMSRDEGHNGEDMGFHLLGVVKAGGDAYLPPSDIAGWHQLFPMSARGRGVVDEKLREIKERVKMFTSGFFKNNSKLEIDRYGRRFFTCATFEGDEYPWQPKVKREDEDDEDDADDEESEESSGSDSEGDGDQAEGGAKLKSVKQEEE